MAGVPIGQVIEKNNRGVSASDVIMANQPKEKTFAQKAGDVAGAIINAPERLGGTILQGIHDTTGIGTDIYKNNQATGLFGNTVDMLGTRDGEVLDNKGVAKDIAGNVLQNAALFAPTGAVAKGASVGTKIAKGAVAGAVGGAEYGAGSALQDQKGVKDVASQAVAGSVAGALIGGAIPGAIAGVGKGKALYAERQAQKAVQEAKNIDNLAGTIVQGKSADVAKAKQALTSIDTTGIKTYEELKNALDEKISSLSSGLDDILTKQQEAKQIAPKLLDNLNVSVKVGDSTVSHNYIRDALAQLEDFYAKTNDIPGQQKIVQLFQKAQNEGLTIKEINDIAKEHGSVLNAFNANGQLASGLSKQAAENTRAGVKATGRELFGDKIYKEVDTQLTNLIRTKELVANVEEKVTQLKQRVTERGFGEKIGRLVFQVADKITGGGLKGFVQSFVPRGEGLKIMNALDLEKALQKNLKTLQKALDGKTESEVEKALTSMLQDSSPFLTNQSTKNIANSVPTSSKLTPKEGVVKKVINTTKDAVNEAKANPMRGSVTPSEFLPKKKVNSEGAEKITNNPIKLIGTPPKEITRNNYVYHNTSPKNIDSITKEGIRGGNYESIYYAPSEFGAEGYGGTNPIKLRTKRDFIGEYVESYGEKGASIRGEIKSKTPVSPESLEIYKDGKWQPLIQKNPLEQEAKKYKSAEDFVKAQGEPLYHGSAYAKDLTSADIIKPSETGELGRGLYFSRQYSEARKYQEVPSATKLRLEMQGKSYWTGKEGVVELSPKDLNIAKITREDVSKIYKEFRKTNDNAGPNTLSQAVGDYYKAKGFDGVEIVNALPNAMIDANQGVIFPEAIKKLKTKSQLTDIWKKANQATPEFNPSTAYTERNINNLNTLANMKVKSPEDVITVYHGTSAKNADSIMKNGLLPQSFLATDKSATNMFAGEKGVIIPIKVKVKDLGFVYPGGMNKNGVSIQTVDKLVKGKDGVWEVK